MNNVAPIATSAKFKDSPAISFNGGNSWKEIGIWRSVPTGTPQDLAALGNVQTWVGLKNSDDQGTQFDLRVEVYRNAEQLAAGQALCITGITRNPDQAKSVLISLGDIPRITLSASDLLALRVLARIGTTPQGAKCSGPGGSHNSATGLRLYFDAASRPSSVEATLNSWQTFTNSRLGLSIQYPSTLFSLPDPNEPGRQLIQSSPMEIILGGALPEDPDAQYTTTGFVIAISSTLYGGPFAIEQYLADTHPSSEPATRDNIVIGGIASYRVTFRDEVGAGEPIIVVPRPGRVLEISYASTFESNSAEELQGLFLYNQILQSTQIQ